MICEQSAAAVQERSETRHNIYCFAWRKPNLTASVFSCTEGYKSLHPGVEVNFRYSVRVLSWPPRVTFFRMLKVKHLHGQHTSSASSEEQMGITAVNTVLSSFLVIHYSLSASQKKAPRQLF